MALQVGDLRAEKYLVVLEKYLKLDVVPGHQTGDDEPREVLLHDGSEVEGEHTTEDGLQVGVAGVQAHGEPG